MCISNKFPDDADAAGLETTFRGLHHSEVWEGSGRGSCYWSAMSAGISQQSAPQEGVSREQIPHFLSSLAPISFCLPLTEGNPVILVQGVSPPGHGAGQRMDLGSAVNGKLADWAILIGALGTHFTWFIIYYILAFHLNLSITQPNSKN